MQSDKLNIRQQEINEQLSVYVCKSGIHKIT